MFTSVEFPDSKSYGIFKERKIDIFRLLFYMVRRAVLERWIRHRQRSTNCVIPCRYARTISKGMEKAVYWRSWTISDWWFDHSNQFTPPPYTLIESFTEKVDRVRPDIDKEERAHALHLIQRGFCYDAKQSITATEILTHPSFNYIMKSMELPEAKIVLIEP